MNLYISDLDGTLLNDDAKLSKTTIKLLNKAINKNINFTIATARTPATVCDIMKDINLKIPAILMNGSVIYDVKNNHYIKYNELSNDIALKIIQLLKNENINAFVYTIKNDFLNVYHNKLIKSYEINFFNERSNKTIYKKFIESPVPKNSNILYFTILEKEQVINNLYDKLKLIDNINITKYEDHYNKGLFYMEIYSIKSSKANGINYLKRTFNYNKIISFGDNYNDIPMFNISDYCYAVANAVNSLKEISTGIIDSNIHDSVAKFILN